MKFKNTFLYHVLPLLLIVCAGVILLLPFSRSGYFPTHDGEWAVVRLGDMFREVRDGQIPARFSGNLNSGFGYPLFNFAYPLPYYLGLPFVFMHVGLVGSIKLLFAGSVLVSMIGMYFLSKELWESRMAGIVSAISYAYFPYRMVDLYVRGSLGETMASALFPFIMLFFLLLFKSKKKILPSICASICLGLLILTHNIMAVLFMLVLIPLLLLLWWDKKENGIWFLGSLIGGLTLSAFFWIPALVEKQYISLSRIPIANRDLYFVSLKQLLISPWGYAPPTELHGFTYQVGWPQLIILFLSIIFSFWWGRKNNTLLIKHSALFFSVIVLLFLAMLFRFSAGLWHLPIISEINYPWTLLLPIGFLISLLSGYLQKQIVWVKSLSLLCITVAVILYLPWAKPEQYVNRGEGYYLTNDATTTSSDELMPLWVKEKPLERKTKVEILSGKGEIELIENSSNQIIFVTKLSDPSKIRINTLYYPGWNIRIDNQRTDFSFANKHGVMDVSVANGIHRVVSQFSETPLRMISDYVSLASILLISLLFSVRVFSIFSKKK